MAARRTRVGRDLPEFEGTIAKFYDLADSGMSEVDHRLRAERALKQARMFLGSCILRERSRRNVGQVELARRIGSTKLRIAQLERGAGSMDMIYRALFALGLSQREIGEALWRAA